MLLLCYTTVIIMRGRIVNQIFRLDLYSYISIEPFARPWDRQMLLGGVKGIVTECKLSQVKLPLQLIGGGFVNASAPDVLELTQSAYLYRYYLCFATDVLLLFASICIL